MTKQSTESRAILVIAPGLLPLAMTANQASRDHSWPVGTSMRHLGEDEKVLAAKDAFAVHPGWRYVDGRNRASKMMENAKARERNNARGVVSSNYSGEKPTPRSFPPLP